MHRRSRSANRRTPDRLTGVRSLIDECWRLSHGDHCASTADGVSHRVCGWSSRPVHRVSTANENTSAHVGVSRGPTTTHRPMLPHVARQQLCIHGSRRVVHASNCVSTEIFVSRTRDNARCHALATVDRAKASVHDTDAISVTVEFRATHCALGQIPPADCRSSVSSRLVTPPTLETLAILLFTSWYRPSSAR